MATFVRVGMGVVLLLVLLMTTLDDKEGLACEVVVREEDVQM
jgi:hypothetical protein